jgi:adenylate cyclase
MLAPLNVRVYEDQRLAHAEDCDGAVELGRQGEGDGKPYSRQAERGRCRLVIAPRDERTVSRRHALLEPLAGGKVRLTNLSKTLPVRLPDGTELGPRGVSEVPLPAVLTLGKRTVRVQEAEARDVALHGLAEATAPPGGGPAPVSGLSTLAGPGGGFEGKALVRWLQAALDVLQSAASSADFFDRAAQALVDLVDLDSGRVLILEQGEWKARSHRTAPRFVNEPGRPPSRQVLNAVRGEKKTFRKVPDPAGQAAASLQGVEAFVAAPILDRHGAVIGALYGDRREGGPASPGPITELEAMLVEVLARGVAAGLARLEQEQAALAARVQFEQFFTPELSRQLSLQPDLLKGRDAEVTVLFCDIRGFSRISERLGPAGTVEWVGDVMAALWSASAPTRGCWWTTSATS